MIASISLQTKAALRHHWPPIALGGTFAGMQVGEKHQYIQGKDKYRVTLRDFPYNSVLFGLVENCCFFAVFNK